MNILFGYVTLGLIGKYFFFSDLKTIIIIIIITQLNLIWDARNFKLETALQQ